MAELVSCNFCGNQKHFILAICPLINVVSVIRPRGGQLRVSDQAVINHVYSVVGQALAIDSGSSDRLIIYRSPLYLITNKICVIVKFVNQ